MYGVNSPLPFSFEPPKQMLVEQDDTETSDSEVPEDKTNLMLAILDIQSKLTPEYKKIAYTIINIIYDGKVQEFKLHHFRSYHESDLERIRQAMLKLYDLQLEFNVLNADQ